MSAAAASEPMPEPSGLGCQLHDWTAAGHERVRTAPVLRKRGILFDLDDTLYAREEYVQSGLLAAARHVEERFGLAAMDAFATMAAARRAGQHGRELQALCHQHELPIDHIPALVGVIRDHQPVLRLPRRTAAVLRRLRNDGWQLAIVTNGLPQVQRAKVAALGLAPLVDHVIYAEELAFGGKPALAVFRAALRRMELPARRCVFVGDDPRCDIAGARAAGLRTVRVTTFAPSYLDDETADASIAAIETLPRIVADLIDSVTPHAA